ncbi:hypothetical protein E4T85_21565 [Bacillus stratosphericus]|nr:hypothetical protein E4T85_21565 [Bacillus stratosphericus]
MNGMRTTLAEGVRAGVVAAQWVKWTAFGILKRQSKMFTLSVENIRWNTSLPVIKKKTMPDNVGYTGCFKSYDVLDVSEFTPAHQSFPVVCRPSKPNFNTPSEQLKTLLKWCGV